MKHAAEDLGCSFANSTGTREELVDRRAFLQVSVPAGLALASGIPLGTQKHSVSSDSWTIANTRLKIILSEAMKGGLSAFTDLKSQRNFIASELPLYRLFAVQKGKDTVELSSLDAASVKVDRTSAGQSETLTLSYDRHRFLDITVVCSVTLEADSPLSKWRIAIKNNTSYGIRAIHYPVVESHLMLGDSAKDDYFIWPATGGMKWPNPAETPPLAYDIINVGSVKPVQYPGGAALQLQAYYDGTAGLYMATHDAGINVKHFGLRRMKDGLDISIEHNYDERPGLSFDLPYDTVLGVFHGEWYAAADLYKEWATKQYWCAKKVVERDDLPAWLKEPRPVLEFECRADYQRVHGWVPFPPNDYPNGRFWPAKKIIPLSKRFSELFGSPVTVWYNGWEKFGNPAGPVDTLPPLEGTESLRAAMDELARNGYIPYMAVWGNHWHYKRSAAGYDGWERFEREGAPLAVMNEHGEIPTYGGVEFTYANLCQGSEKTRQLFVDYFMEVMNLGAAALEFDIGVWPSPCYNDQHGHSMGYGPWMGQKTTEFFRKIRQAAKKRNPEAALSVEGVAEAWIQDLDMMLDRPYFPGFIPLFTYIYHEYMPMLGGDGRYGVAHPEEQLMLHAANFVYGHLRFVAIGDNGYDFEVNPNYPIFTLLKNMCQADRTYARDYVVLGRMLEPTQLQCLKVKADGYIPLIRPLLDLPDPPIVEVPRIMHSVWSSPDNRIGYVLVNWSGTTEQATLSLVRKEGKVTVITAMGRTSVSGQDVKTGQITASVPAWSVMLVEQV
jgi:Domain of unknown function (DUF6259)